MPPKSDVWKHFLTENKTTARCRRCSATVAHASNTTNLWTHMRTKHGILGGKGPAKPGDKTAGVVENEDDPEPLVAATSTSTQAASTSSSEPPQAAESSSSTSKTKRLKTVSVYEAFSRQASLEVGGDKYNAITEALIFMIVKDSMPFLTPEREGFKHFLKVCVPMYKPISRQSVTRMVESKYDLISAKVKKDLDQANNVSLTCDIWTETHTNQSYLGLTVHFLLPDSMELQTIMLEVIPLEERHTALNIVKDLENVLQKWSIPKKKIAAIVTDNGANIKLAVEMLLGPQKHLSCLVHSFNLVAPEAIKSAPEIDLLREKVKTIVTYFKRSVPASDALRQAQVRTGCQAPLKLKQDVQTRFYSTYIMLEKFVNVKDHDIASAVISLPGGPDMLTGSELNVVQELLSFLKPFQAAITELSAEKSVTCSKVIPLVSCIASAIKNSKVSSPPMVQLKEKFLSGISKRFPHVEKNDLLAMSTLTDPRFKRIH